MVAHRPIQLSQCLRHLHRVGFTLLAVTSMLVASTPGPRANSSNDRPHYLRISIAFPTNSSDNFRSKLRALDFGRSPRAPMLTKPVADGFCVDPVGTPPTAISPALLCLRHRPGARSSHKQLNCIHYILKHCAGNQAAAFAETGTVRQQRPELHADALANLVQIPTPLSARSHTFTSSNGTKITYILIMALNASRDAFGPQVYMDANNKAVVCAISPSDTETLSAFRNSLADAFVQEAADPGEGLPSVNVERSVADGWAAEATNGIIGRCLLAKNDGSDPIVLATHQSEQVGPRRSLTWAFLPWEYQLRGRFCKELAVA